MKFNFSPAIESDDSKKNEFNKKINWTKYLLGVYTLGFDNKNNKKVESKFLSIFCFLAIALFIISMIVSISVISNGVYKKVTSNNFTIKGVGLVLPSFSKDSLNEIRSDQEKINKGEEVSTKRRDFVFIPVYLLIPILFIIGSIHEFGHYISCRKFGIKVDEYGLGALSLLCIPVMPLGYVKPNVEELENSKKYSYLSIVSSGIFMNIIGGIIFLILYIIFPIKFFDYLFTFDLAIILFNVLPISFLDGGLFFRKLNKKIGFIVSILSIVILVIAII
jgi:Zn-dependent protease